MTIQVLKPWSRLSAPPGTKVTALHTTGKDVYVGLSNGNLSIWGISFQSDTPGSQPTSIRSFRLFADPKHMFVDNKNAQSLVGERVFRAATLAITGIHVVPLFADASTAADRMVLAIATDELLQVHEWVGAHLNLVHKLEDARGCTACSYANINGERLLVVGSRKKVLVYRVELRTRNIYDFVLVASHLLREKVRHLCALPEDTQAVVAAGHSFYTVDLRDGYALHELSKGFAGAGAFAHPSFSYFGLSGNGPAVTIVPCGHGRALIVNELHTAILRHANGHHRLEDSRVTLSAIPVAVSYLHPCYVVATFTKTLEVIDIESGSIVQSFKHMLNSPHVSVALSRRNALIGAGSLVFHFSVVPSQKQLDQLLSPSDAKDSGVDARMAGIDQALTYISSLDDTDPYFQDKLSAASLAKVRQLYLRDLQKEKAFLLFERLARYSEALVDIASEWVISLTDILPLFPDFLSGASHKTSDVVHADSRCHGTIKKVTVDDLKQFKLAEKNPSQPASKDSNSRTAALFSAAVSNFIIYLTDQRRIHYSLLNSTAEISSIKWKGVELVALDIYPGLDAFKIPSMLLSCIATIDTTLFLCYYHTKPMLLGPLLRLPNNKCNANVVNDCLLEKVNAHNDDLEGFLSQLLDFYYGRELHDDALAMLKDLAHTAANSVERDFEKLLRSPILSIRYLQNLTNEHLDLVFKYLHWILEENPAETIKTAERIFMNDSYECESYNNFKVFEFLKNFGKSDTLPIRYFEWLLNETDILEMPSRKNSVLKITTKLSLYYLRCLKLLKCADTEFYESSWYKKLHKLLESDKEFEPWTVLKNIPTSEDKYLRFCIFIYKRLGEHQKSVDILYNQLADLNGAMNYCADLYEQPNGRLKGSELLHKLLEDLLMHCDENQDAVVALLVAQGHRMSTLHVLAALPNTFPLHKLSSFLAVTTHSKQHDLYNSRMTGQLYKIGSSKLRYQLLVAQLRSCTVDSSNNVCPVCGKVLSGILCAGEQVVHYSCVK